MDSKSNEANSTSNLKITTVTSNRKTTSTITSYKPSMLKFHPFQTYPLQNSRGMMQSWNLFSIQQGIRHPFKKYPPTPEYLAPLTNPTPFGQMLRTIIIILSFKYSTHIIYNFKDLYININICTQMYIYIRIYINWRSPDFVHLKSTVGHQSFFHLFSAAIHETWSSRSIREIQGPRMANGAAEDDGHLAMIVHIERIMK